MKTVSTAKTEHCSDCKIHERKSNFNRTKTRLSIFLSNNIQYYNNSRSISHLLYLLYHTLQDTKQNMVSLLIRNACKNEIDL